jgi:cation transport ATPase
MLTKVAATINLSLGCIWLVGQSWMWMMIGGISEIHYSMKGFFSYSLFLILFLCGPVCLIVGAWRVLKRRSTAVSMVLNLIALMAMAYFLVPVVYDSLHPAPLEYVDNRFTASVAAVVLLTFMSSCYLAMRFLQDRREMKKVTLDAA